jgi:hypothetical protein
VQAWADPVAQTTMEGFSEGNLEKYTQYGDAQFKAAVTTEVFNAAVSQVSGPLGAFESITFLRTEEASGYIIVHYKAKYAKTDIGVRMVFNKDHQVSGQFFE